MTKKNLLKKLTMLSEDTERSPKIRRQKGESLLLDFINDIEVSNLVHSIK